jgi:tetratricopeptide (TPR) repeat protein
MGAAGDHDRELAALSRALEGRPDDPETLYLISLARLRAGEFPAAEKTLRRLLSVTEDRKETAVHVLGVLRLGQALERLGKPEKALERFEELLTLPDQDDSHRRAREAIERIGKGEAGD